MLMRISYELVCTATGLLVKPLALFLGIVNVLYMTIIGRNSIRDKVVRILKVDSVILTVEEI